MASPDQITEAKRQKAAENELRREYIALRDNPALCDIVNTLIRWHDDARKSGDSEMENATKKSLHHEAAKSLGRVLKHIESKQVELD